MSKENEGSSPENQNPFAELNTPVSQCPQMDMERDGTNSGVPAWVCMVILVVAFLGIKLAIELIAP